MRTVGDGVGPSSRQLAGFVAETSSTVAIEIMIVLEHSLNYTGRHYPSWAQDLLAVAARALGAKH